MTAEIRPIAEHEFEAAARSLETSFTGSFTEEDLRAERLVAEPDRWLAAVEDGRIVGGAAAASFQITVPGGRAVSAAGITSVGVQPTHRRRGINTAMMRAQLDDVHERGEPVAVLYASEGSIYGRFGYGVAAFFGEINLEVERSAFIRGYRSSGGLRLLERTDALPDAARVRHRAGASSGDGRDGRPMVGVALLRIGEGEGGARVLRGARHRG